MSASVAGYIAYVVDQGRASLSRGDGNASPYCPPPSAFWSRCRLLRGSLAQIKEIRTLKSGSGQAGGDSLPYSLNLVLLRLRDPVKHLGLVLEILLQPDNALVAKLELIEVADLFEAYRDATGVASEQQNGFGKGPHGPSSQGDPERRRFAGNQIASGFTRPQVRRSDPRSRATEQEVRHDGTTD